MPEVRYRVTCRTAGHPSAGLVGDFPELETARLAACAVKEARPRDEVSIRSGDALTEEEHLARDATVEADEWGRHWQAHDPADRAFVSEAI